MKKQKKDVIASPKAIKSPLQLIKDGILDNNLDLIVEGYNALTGEGLVIGGEVPSKPVKRRGRPPKPGKAVSTKAVEDDTEVSIQFTKITGGPNAPLGQLRKPCLPFSKIHDEEARELNNKLAKAAAKTKVFKDDRPAYKPIMVNCSRCNTSFELKKEYPFGRVNDPARKDIYYCNRCRGGGNN